MGSIGRSAPQLLRLLFPTGKTLEAMHPTARNEFITDLRIVQAAQRSGIVAKRAKAADEHWNRWLAFCQEISVDPWFTQGDDPIPYLQVFAQRLRDGRLAPSGQPIRSTTVTDILRSVGQGYARVGATDIRRDRSGNKDFRLDRQLRSYAKEDPPSNRVKPVPIQVVVEALRIAYAPTQQDEGLRAVADMICIGYYYLMRPGEHTKNSTDTAFRLIDSTESKPSSTCSRHP